MLVFPRLIVFLVLLVLLLLLQPLLLVVVLLLQSPQLLFVSLIELLPLPLVGGLLSQPLSLQLLLLLKLLALLILPGVQLFQLLLMLYLLLRRVAAAGVATVVAIIAAVVAGIARTVVCIPATASAVIGVVKAWPRRWRTVGHPTIPLKGSAAVTRRLTRLVGGILGLARRVAAIGLVASSAQRLPSLDAARILGLAGIAALRVLRLGHFRRRRNLHRRMNRLLGYGLDLALL